jgi:membrane protease YdiL (CAAX protease family)
MTVNAEVPAPTLPPTRWGIGDALLGLLIANTAALFIGAAILAATGYVQEGADGRLPLAMIAVLQIPLWAGYLGMPLYAARRKGNGVVADFGLRMERWDVLKGIGVGLATQLVAIPLVYVLIFALTDALGWEFDQDLSAAARELTDKATDPLGVVLLVLIVAIAAPVIEELFFRGLLLRSFEQRFGRAWALWGSSLIFGAVHLQLLQLPALVLIGLVLGWLTLRTGRLGPAVWAHIAFNSVATVTLLVGAT